MPSRLTVLKPDSVNVTEYVPGTRLMILYWPSPSVTTVRLFSISAGLDASTVTPGMTPPLASRTTPAIACANATDWPNAKHASASHVWVRVKVFGTAAHFIIEDDGLGFTPEAKTCGDGLKNLRDRAAAIGVEFELRSQLGEGTFVSWKVPLDSVGPAP